MITRPITRSVTSPIARAITAAYGAWNPRALFAAGEQGVIYDPSDLATLWQDAAGTTPVTAAGQPVGLMLDKRLGLVRGVELVVNGAFTTDLSGWSNASGGTGTSAWEAGKLRVVGADASTNTGARYQSLATVVGRLYEITGSAQLTSGAGAVLVGNSAMNGGVLALSVSNSGAFRAVFTASAALTYVGLRNGSVGGNLTFDDISVRELPGNHAFQPTAASRPMLRQNATTGAYYLETDGSDDWMSTSAIDFTATDKVSVFTGVRKLSDAATALVAELSTASETNNGTFGLFAPSGGGSNKLTFRIRGTLDLAAQAQSSVYNAPITSVLTGSGNIAGSACSLRANGSLAALAGGSPGTGNYGNHPLYLFRRAGTSLPFNGHFYGLTIVGRLCTDAETRNVERLYANKTGVVLS